MSDPLLHNETLPESAGRGLGNASAFLMKRTSEPGPLLSSSCLTTHKLKQL